MHIFRTNKLEKNRVFQISDIKAFIKAFIVIQQN